MIRTSATLIAVLWAAVISAQAAAQTASVTVLRGSGADAAATSQAKAGAGPVLRGAPVVARAAPPPEAPREYRTLVGAGETLWLRHARTGRLTACWVEDADLVGRSVIRCTR